MKYFKREFRSLQPNNIETSTKNIRNCNDHGDSDGDGKGQRLEHNGSVIYTKSNLGRGLGNHWT